MSVHSRGLAVDRIFALMMVFPVPFYGLLRIRP